MHLHYVILVIVAGNGNLFDNFRYAFKDLEEVQLQIVCIIDEEVAQFLLYPFNVIDSPGLGSDLELITVIIDDLVDLLNELFVLL